MRDRGARNSLSLATCTSHSLPHLLHLPACPAPAISLASPPVTQHVGSHGSKCCPDSEDRHLQRRPQSCCKASHRDGSCFTLTDREAQQSADTHRGSGRSLTRRSLSLSTSPPFKAWPQRPSIPSPARSQITTHVPTLISRPPFHTAGHTRELSHVL